MNQNSSVSAVIKNFDKGNVNLNNKKVFIALDDRDNTFIDVSDWFKDWVWLIWRL